MKIEKTELKVFRQALKCGVCGSNLQVTQDFNADYKEGPDGQVNVATWNCQCVPCGTMETMLSKDYPGGIVYEEVKA